MVRRPRPALVAWAELERSELFGWFGVHEEGREKLPDGLQRFHLKPGGYQEAVDIWADLDREGGVRRAHLALARAWVDTEQTAPFALDLAKSALPVFAPRSALVGQFAAWLQHEMRRMPVITGPGALQPPAEAPPTGVQEALAAYRGERARAELTDAATRLTIENTTEGGVPVLSLTLEPVA
jgi:hypothetical protein